MKYYLIPALALLLSLNGQAQDKKFLRSKKNKQPILTPYDINISRFYEFMDQFELLDIEYNCKTAK